MKSKWILILIILSLPAYAFGQQGQSGISITTSPPGAIVSLVGDITISGVSPVVFEHDLNGKYRVEISKDGYENYSTIVYLQIGKTQSMNIVLNAKTRFKAFTRSLLIPGWGQSYSDQKKKGGLFLALAAGTVSAYFLANSSYNNKLDDFQTLEKEFNDTPHFEEKERLYGLMIDAKKEAYDAETLRRFTIGAVVAAWSVNLLDLFFHFPEAGGQISNQAITIKPDYEYGGGQIVFRYKF